MVIFRWLYSLEQATGGIGLHMNAEKTDYMCLNRKKRGHLHIKWWFSEISGQAYVPLKKRLIYWKWHQYVTNEGMDY